LIQSLFPTQFRHLHTDIYGNREFVEHLRNRGKFFDHDEKRERDLILIDYAQTATKAPGSGLFLPDELEHGAQKYLYLKTESSADFADFHRFKNRRKKSAQICVICG